MVKTLRLAVTGLSRAGKTVFITSFVHNLLSAANGAANMPNLGAARERRLTGATVMPAGAQALPQFPYERNIAHLGAGEGWPPHTETISRMEIGLRFQPRRWLGRRLARGAVSVELIDYPGEWLLDLPLKDMSFAQWSSAVLADCAEGPRATRAAEWLSWLCAHGPDSPADEQVARRAHELYRDFLLACRDKDGLCFLQPGRFIRRGDLGDLPLLWFCPLPPAEGGKYKPGSLGALMAERFEAYKTKVVLPFFHDHFRRFDRQILLVDVLSALHGGWHVFQDTSRALEVVSRAFAYGRGSFFTNWFRPRIDRVLFAATKADHVTLEQRPQLRELLRHLVTGPAGSAGYDGAAAHFQALASIVCTVDERAVIDGQPVHVVVGNIADGGRRAQVFPGQIPIEPPTRDFFLKRFVGYPEFLPPRFNQAPVGGIPHYGLDEAAQILIGSELE